MLISSDLPTPMFTNCFNFRHWHVFDRRFSVADWEVLGNEPKTYHCVHCCRPHWCSTRFLLGSRVSANVPRPASVHSNRNPLSRGRAVNQDTQLVVAASARVSDGKRAASARASCSRSFAPFATSPAALATWGRSVPMLAGNTIRLNCFRHVPRRMYFRVVGGERALLMLRILFDPVLACYCLDRACV